MSRINGNYGREGLEGFQDSEETGRAGRVENQRPTRPKVFNPNLVNEENVDSSVKMGYHIGKQ
jgi:hypothetical protein